MHIILKNHVDEVAEDFELQHQKLDKQFEYFCNYCVVSKHYFGRFNPAVVTTENDDASIDGLAIIIDGDLITTIDDAVETFKTHKVNLSVEVIFSQTKSGERFRKEEIANFKIGIEDFISLDPKLPSGKLNSEAVEILKIVLKNLKKIKNRRPDCHIYYCTSGVYSNTREIKGAFDIIKRYVDGTEIFHSVDVTPLGRKELLQLYGQISDKNEAKLQLIDYFGMPAIPNIPQSYVAIVNAKKFVESLLEDSEGRLREAVFEENIRSYLGNKNDVNAAIQATLRNDNKKPLFSVLNNGVTIVAPELTLTPNTKEIQLTSYQIINGCQTSSTLYENKQFLSDTVNVVVKFIESPENDAASDIIAATNSQSDIPKEAFFGLRDKAKLVQKYFLAQNSVNSPENQIHFERRQNEYKHSGYQSTRIFDVREVARCYAAMFLELPHNAARYVATIFSSSGDRLFREEDHESYYYVSCLALYKYQTLINGRKIGAQNYIKVRWHIIQLFKWLSTGSMDAPQPNSRKAEEYASQLINALSAEKRSYIKVFERCQEIIDAVGFPTDDEIKRAKFGQEIMNAAKSALQKRPSKKARK